MINALLASKRVVYMVPILSQFGEVRQKEYLQPNTNPIPEQRSSAAFLPHLYIVLYPTIHTPFLVSKKWEKVPAARWL